ncbi:MAG: pyridoxamine 5'-phosphate oxidase family protein [Mariprofundaceae bacterium]|nr:pyridoxamine 5'-phosphate oxidase family protein [Mariprofundaceae bacterium]
MNDWEQDIFLLLRDYRIGFLSTQGKYGPETSMAPFALYEDSILLHLSTLARHTANLAAHPAAGFMICTPETSMESPLALPRLSIQGVVSPLADDALATAKESYLQAVPEAGVLFGFADFRLYALIPAHLHWVGGFGSAREISLAAWRKTRSGT